MSMTLEERIAKYKESEKANKELAKMCVTSLAKAENRYKAEECRQMIEWLSELQERRKQPEVIHCGECRHYKPMSNHWGKCGVHSSPAEKYRTCQICDYCSWSERRTDEMQ